MMVLGIPEPARTAHSRLQGPGENQAMTSAPNMVLVWHQKCESIFPQPTSGLFWGWVGVQIHSPIRITHLRNNTRDFQNWFVPQTTTPCQQLGDRWQFAKSRERQILGPQARTPRRQAPSFGFSLSRCPCCHFSPDGHWAVRFGCPIKPTPKIECSFLPLLWGWIFLSFSNPLRPNGSRRLPHL